MADGVLSVAEAYEVEYELLYRPFFTWAVPDPLPAIAPGKRIVLPVKCYGKVAWCVQHRRIMLVSLAGPDLLLSFVNRASSQGAIQISYSYINRQEPDSQLSATDTFYARQIIYPVNVTVYHTLELSNLDIIPLYSAPCASQLSSHNLTKSLRDIQSDDDDYCLVSVDVSNIYGLPFTVTLERRQEGTFLVARLDIVQQHLGAPITGTPLASITRTVAPGCTNRFVGAYS